MCVRAYCINSVAGLGGRGVTLGRRLAGSGEFASVVCVCVFVCVLHQKCGRAGGARGDTWS